MPVKNGAFDKLESYTFKTEAFRNTYAALKSTVESCTFLSEPSMAGYFPNTYTLYSKIRALQKELPSMYENGKPKRKSPTNSLTCSSPSPPLNRRTKTA